MEKKTKGAAESVDVEDSESDGSDSENESGTDTESGSESEASESEKEELEEGEDEEWVVRAATKEKIVELLFSPYYNNCDFRADILDTFEVLFFLTFLKSLIWEFRP